MFKFTKKILAMALMMFSLLLGGFSQCQAADFGAEKAVLAYAQVYGYGSTAYAKEAGIKQSEMSQIRIITFNKFRDSFKEFCLSDATLNKLTDVYLTKLENSMDITAKLKKSDPNHPIITITAKVLSESDFEKQATDDPNIQAFAFAIMGMKNDGKTEADLKADATVQATAQDCIGKFIDGLNFGSPMSIDITGMKIKGADGKTYWAPQETDALYQFMTADYPMTGK